MKRLVSGPNSFFMDVKCPDKSCAKLSIVFSHSQIPIKCKCGKELCWPTGGIVKMSAGTGWRRKVM